MSELYDILTETPPTKVVLLALDQGLWDCERSLAELSALCEANHMEAVAQITQKRQTPETGIVLGSGKLEEAAAAAAELGAVCAVFDGELTGSQIRNISTALGGLEVIDRTMLILEIFRSRAATNEGKLQTELALLRKLAENRGHIVTYDAICDAVWGADYYGYENSLGVHIRHLREKLETEPGAPRFLRTVRGIGYKLTKEGEP